MNLKCVIAMCGTAGLAAGAPAQCPNPQWSPQFGTLSTGLSQGAASMVVLDIDGPGPGPSELYIGGRFQSAGGLPIAGLARWDGQAWHAVGTGSPINVASLCIFDPDGPGPGLPTLAAHGTFAGIDTVGIWNGSQWTTLPPLPLVSSVYDGGMIAYDPDGSGPALPEIWIAGSFIFQQQVTYGVIRWNGQAWSTLPWSVLYGDAHAIALYDGDGGGPGLASIHVAMSGDGGVLNWDGSQWQVVGGGVHRSGYYLCRSLCVVDEDGPGPTRPVLLAGGNFSTAGGVAANSIARWNGTAWSAMGSGIGTGGFATAEVQSITAVDSTGGAGAPNLFAFSFGPQVGVFRWDPASQSWPFVAQAPVWKPWMQTCMASYSGGEALPSLYITGNFDSMGGVPSFSFARYRCDTCYVNCDGTLGPPKLTGNDFQCFLDRFVAGSSYANCDGVAGLTGNDFQCFLNKYVAGCS